MELKLGQVWVENKKFVFYLGWNCVGIEPISISIFQLSQTMELGQFHQFK